MRSCDGCTMCCYLPAVAELSKPIDTVCEHCAVGTGCTIYKRRPQGCRDFKCLWLANPAVPAQARPDRSGVVFEPFSRSRTCLAMVDPARPDAWRQPAAGAVIENLRENDVAVVVTCGGEVSAIVLPAGRKTRQVMDDVATEVN